MNRFDRFMAGPWPIALLICLALLVVIGPVSCQFRIEGVKQEVPR